MIGAIGQGLLIYGAWCAFVVILGTLAFGVAQLVSPHRSRRELFLALERIWFLNADEDTYPDMERT